MFLTAVLDDVSEAPTDWKFKRYARRMSEDSESLGDEQVSDADVENDLALRVPVKAERVQKKTCFRQSTKIDQSETTPETQSESMKVLTETRGLVQALMNQLLELNKQNTGLQNGSSPQKGLLYATVASKKDIMLETALAREANQRTEVSQG